MFSIPNSNWSSPFAAGNPAFTSAPSLRSLNRFASGALNELPHAEVDGFDQPVEFSPTARRFAKIRRQRPDRGLEDAEQVRADADRITSDDAAEERAAFARSNLLFQGRTALLAQANLSDHAALYLLD
jgi:hypothetical protein